MSDDAKLIALGKRFCAAWDAEQAVFARNAQRSGLAVRDAFAFGPDYARTLAGWLAAFDAAWPEISRQGFDESFRRLWRFYLAYCEAGFRSGCTDVHQFELMRD